MSDAAENHSLARRVLRRVPGARWLVRAGFAQYAAFQQRRAAPPTPPPAVASPAEDPRVAPLLEEVAGLRTALRAVERERAAAFERAKLFADRAADAAGDRDHWRARFEDISNQMGALTERLLAETHRIEDVLRRDIRDVGAQALATRTMLSSEMRSLGQTGPGHAQASLYLDLLEQCLTGVLFDDGSAAPWTEGGYDPARRAIGRDWPATACTMIGTARMRNLRVLLERALAEEVPGDVIETGVWRGGACIYARGILEAHGDATRRVFVADSFRGLPPPDAEAYPADAGDIHSTFAQLAISRAEVEANFRRYGLLDARVVFLEGWFKDTLPAAPIERLAVLRLDGDMYESTIQALEALYDKVSPGGFVIIDDHILPPCARAVEDFRAARGITAPLEPVDGAAVWWQVPRG